MGDLRHHRERLAQNPEAFEKDMGRLERTLSTHLKSCGYRRAGTETAKPVRVAMVEAIFDAQGRRPLFHVDGGLPYCWNAPKDWSKDYLRYEWGHLMSKNQNEDAHNITNLALLSARCNQHIQSSMNIDEVREWLDGSRLAARIDEVLASRVQLFRSARWRQLVSRLQEIV
jgi:hypothetical protein